MCVCGRGWGGGGGILVLTWPASQNISGSLALKNEDGYTVVRGGPQTKLADHLPAHSCKQADYNNYIHAKHCLWVLQRDLSRCCYSKNSIFWGYGVYIMVESRINHAHTHTHTHNLPPGSDLRALLGPQSTIECCT